MKDDNSRPPLPGTPSDLLNRLHGLDFRRRFRLGPAERAYFHAKGEAVIRSHSADFIAKRLAPSEPRNDGKQTPMRGHPVFIAQHATASCCRGCLSKWHRIARGRQLAPAEQEWIVDVIMLWIAREMERPK